MFVVFENGGKQYKAKKDDVLKLEKFDCKKNDIIKIDNILLLSDEHNQITIGTPHVNGVELHAKVIDNIKDKKVLIFKKKRRHNYRRKLGHRQNLVLLRVSDIKLAKTNKSIPEEKNIENNVPNVKKATKPKD